MTLRTFSSILPFTRRFGVRGVTCMTNGAQGGGGVRQARQAINAKNIRAVLCSELKGKPRGVPLKDLVASVRAKWPGELDDQKGYGRIWGVVWGMEKKGEIERVAYGTDSRWRLVDAKPAKPPKPAQSANDELEREWYEPVKDQLVEMEEFKGARIIGDRVKGGKWENPDIVGSVVPNTIARDNGFKSKVAVVEVKRSKTVEAYLTGFAQACSYQSFAHMVWLVVPKWDDPVVGRVKRLCQEHGVGFAFFVKDGEGWRLEIQASPRSQEPDPEEFAGFLRRLNIRRIEELS